MHLCLHCMNEIKDPHIKICQSCKKEYELKKEIQEPKEGYETAYEASYRFIRGRIHVLRPIKRDYKEVKILHGIARMMGAKDLEDQLNKLYNDYLENEKLKKVRSVQRLGYEVST